MILSIKHNFIFIHIPKTGGESITQKLRWHTTKKRRGEDLQDFIYWGQDDEVDLAHIYQEILSRYVPQDMINKYFKFCIVRNPYNRCYSAYRDLFMGAEDKHAIKSSYGVWVSKYKKPESLGEYCNMLSKVSSNTPTRVNIHVIPQYMYIYDKTKKNMDYIGHYETMDKDMKHIYEKFNIKEDVWFDNQRTYNVKVDNLKKSYMKEFTPPDIHAINRTYFADFILFDYPIVVPQLCKGKSGVNNDVSTKISSTYKKKLIAHFKKLVLNKMKDTTNILKGGGSPSSPGIITGKITLHIVNNKITTNDTSKWSKLIEDGVKEVLNCYKLPVKTLVLDKKMLSSDPKELLVYIYYSMLHCS